MLPQTYRQLYQSFRNLLQQLQVPPNTDFALLQASFQTAQAFWQQQIVPLSLEEPTCSEIVKMQSIQVEINKQMRLLGTDLMFLKAARLLATQKQRQQQIGDRIDLLLRYCDAVLEE